MMPTLTIGNSPEEARDIMGKAKPEGRIQFGTHLAAIGQEAGLTDDDVEALRKLRAQTQAEPLTFE